MIVPGVFFSFFFKDRFLNVLTDFIFVSLLASTGVDL